MYEGIPSTLQLQFTCHNIHRLVGWTAVQDAALLWYFLI